MKRKKTIEFYKVRTNTLLNLPYADEGVKAGFPSPAQDYLSESIDLNKELIRNPASTFIARAVGDSMIGEGIHDGDLLIVDKLGDFADGDLAICFLDGEFTVKRVQIDRKDKIIWLVPSNPRYPPIKVTEDNDFRIWGKVNYVISDKRGRKKCSA